VGEWSPECCQCLVQGVNHTQQRSSRFPQNLKHASQTEFEVGRGNDHARAGAQQNQLGAKAARVLAAVESDSPISSMGGPGVITAEAEMPLI
jgi:hypothetical protein